MAATQRTSFPSFYSLKFCCIPAWASAWCFSLWRLSPAARENGVAQERSCRPEGEPSAFMEEGVGETRAAGSFRDTVPCSGGRCPWLLQSQQPSGPALLHPCTQMSSSAFKRALQIMGSPTTARLRSASCWPHWQVALALRTASASSSNCEPSLAGSSCFWRAPLPAAEAHRPHHFRGLSQGNPQVDRAADQTCSFGNYFPPTGNSVVTEFRQDTCTFSPS